MLSSSLETLWMITFALFNAVHWAASSGTISAFIEVHPKGPTHAMTLEILLNMHQLCRQSGLSHYTVLACKAKEKRNCQLGHK